MSEVQLLPDSALLLGALTEAARAGLLGGVLFLVFLVRPLGWLLGAEGVQLHRDVARLAGWSAQALVLCSLVALLLQGPAPAGPVAGWGLLGVGFAKVAAGGIAAWLIALLLVAGWSPPVLLLPLGAVVLAAALDLPAATSDPLRLGAVALHLFGAAIWIGGIPCFAAALARLRDGAGWHAVGVRFSRLAALGALAVAASGAALAWRDVAGAAPDWSGFYATAYGLTVGAKAILFLALLVTGAGHVVTVRRLLSRPGTPVTRMRRIAEVQAGLGLALFVAAASLAALPHPVDTPERAAPAQLVALAAPATPQFGNPLAPPAAEPDAAWSADTWHWCGVLVLAVGLLGLAERAGVGVAGHWPLLIAVLSAFLFVRFDPQFLPLDPAAWPGALRDPAVAWRAAAAAAGVLLGLVAWRARAVHSARRGRLARALPLAVALAGAALLLPPHGPPATQALLAWVRLPLALLAFAGAATLWLELRLDPYESRRAAWLWPVCALLAGLLLVAYRIA